MKLLALLTEAQRTCASPARHRRADRRAAADARGPPYWASRVLRRSAGSVDAAEYDAREGRVAFACSLVAFGSLGASAETASAGPSQILHVPNATPASPAGTVKVSRFTYAL